MVKTEPKTEPETSKPMPSTSISSSSLNKKKYKGVRMRSWGSWVSEIRAPNQKTRIWLGSYSTAEAAARAYDAALLCLKGTSANLNFPEITSSHYIIPDTIMSPKSIQRVAAAAANNTTFNVETTTTTTTPTTTTSPVSPPLPSPSPSSSSSSFSSSPSELQDDDISLIGWSLQPIDTMEPLLWYNTFDGLQSPKYVDQMFSGVSFDLPPPVIDDFLEDGGDIRLWSFC